jgi:ribonuclease HI
MAWWKMCIPKKYGGMGFRDLHAFNHAMLAKQCWRLVTKPDSLCAQILKTKYYPNSDLLKAGPKKGSSFTWQSIIAGLNVFKRGYIWRVGTGEKINIWDDCWIPDSPDRKIQTPKGQVLIKLVNELIDPTTLQWDSALIQDIFNPIDAARILRIPLSESIDEDFIAWHMTKSYCFTVRSAYYTQWNHLHGHKLDRTADQSTSSHNPVWEQVWKLRVPSKIQIFVWRALHGIIPGMSILANKHIPVSGECPVCHQGAEDILHLIFTCNRAKEVWRALGLRHVVEPAIIDRSGSVVLEGIICGDIQLPSPIDSVGIKELIATAAWYIWWQRREIKKGEAVATPGRTAFAIAGLAQNYYGAETAKEPRVLSWTRPDSHTYKINVDAAYFPNGSGAIGVILRNHKGVALAGRSRLFSNVLNAATAEALALKDGLQLTEVLGCIPAVVESDCLEIVNAFNDNNELWSPYAAILADCLHQAQAITRVTVRHCSREANEVAHSLAKHCYSNNLCCNWDDDPPSFLLDRLSHDVRII